MQNAPAHYPPGQQTPLPKTPGFVRFRRRCLWLGALLPLCWILQLVSSAFPQLTEAWFSRGVGPLMQTVIGFSFGWLPFSASEILLIALVLFAVFLLARGTKRCVRKERAFGESLQRAGLLAVGFAGPLYLWFMLAWGLNYSRPPFAVNAGLDVSEPRAGELEKVVARLIDTANELREHVQEDAEGVFRFAEGRQALLDTLPELFEQLALDYPFLAGPRPITKQSLVSPLMTLVGISGIFSPFSGESHVNGTLPDLSFGFAACHEAAHRRGIAREDEANFVAYLASSMSELPDLCYSGTVGVLNYALRDLMTQNPGRARELTKGLAPGVDRDRRAVFEFWKPKTRTRAVIRSVGQATNDVYLKSQRQTAGTASYGHVVRLLIAHERRGDGT